MKNREQREFIDKSSILIHESAFQGNVILKLDVYTIAAYRRSGIDEKVCCFLSCAETYRASFL